MNLITDTIEWFQNRARPRIQEINGRKYKDVSGDLFPIKEPSFPAISQDLTLTGLIDYLNHNPDDHEEQDYYVIIENYRRVMIVSKPYGDFEQRDQILRAEHQSWYNFDGQSRGAIQLRVEKMIVTLQTCFAENAQRDQLVELISNLKVDDESRIQDNGISQTVTVQTGVTTIEEKKIDRYITLKPMVTFPEIEQPEIKYLVRLNQRGHDSVNVELYPFEETLWQNRIATLIQDYLHEKVDSSLIVIR